MVLAEELIPVSQTSSGHEQVGTLLTSGFRGNGAGRFWTCQPGNWLHECPLLRSYRQLPQKSAPNKVERMRAVL